MTNPTAVPSGEKPAQSPANDSRQTAPNGAGGSKASIPAPQSLPPAQDGELDPAGYSALFEVLDRAIHAQVAHHTLGLSPRAMVSAYLDWLGALAFSPGKQAQLIHKAQRKWTRYLTHIPHCMAAGQDGKPSCFIEPLPQDHRYRDPAWQNPPFNAIYQGFLLTQQWWHNATTGVSGMTAQNERAVEFAARQLLDVFSPSNYLATNPVVLDATMKQGGWNLLQGWQHFLEDFQAQVSGRGPVVSDDFDVGRNLAVTPGKVVYRNRLIELIQYSPSTEQVQPEPILIVPAWIMKYYILDLSQTNSMIKFLVDRGYTVFAISWKNPDAGDRDLDMDDYRRLGPETALEVIGEIMPERKVHAVGYCLGGTLLAIAAAYQAQLRKDPFASLTFLAAQIDFEDAGELMLFINEKQLAFLEDLMWEQGFLDSKQMAGAFQLLRSNDLIWSRMVQEYLLGKRTPMNDLMAWNADGTRMPYRMHSEYLSRLFLHNDLAEGRYSVEGRRLALTDIRKPLFVVGTQTDHVAPWHSVYKFNLLTDSEVTFLLTSGGHNAGIVSEPGHRHRSYQVASRLHGEPYIDPDLWAEQTPAKEGSWWLEWADWLDRHSGAKVEPPPLGRPEAGYPPLQDAPGSYVLMP